MQLKSKLEYQSADFINDPCIVAFCGDIGVGKSTLAHDLSDLCGGAVLSFADPLREMIGCIVDKDYLTSKMVDGVRAKDLPIPWLGSPEPVTGRVLLQKCGTEFGRDMIDPNIWVKVAQQRIESYDPDRHIFFDDLRFNNEAEMIRSLGGLVVEVKRRGYSNKSDTHKSEMGISPRYINGVYNL